MGPVEPRFEQTNPDTSVFDVTEWTQMFLLEERWYVAVETRQNTFPTIAPVHTDNANTPLVRRTPAAAIPKVLSLGEVTPNMGRLNKNKKQKYTVSQQGRLRHHILVRVFTSQKIYRSTSKIISLMHSRGILQ